MRCGRSASTIWISLIRLRASGARSQTRNRRAHQAKIACCLKTRCEYSCARISPRDGTSPAAQCYLFFSLDNISIASLRSLQFRLGDRNASDSSYCAARRLLHPDIRIRTIPFRRLLVGRAFAPRWFRACGRDVLLYVVSVRWKHLAARHHEDHLRKDDAGAVCAAHDRRDVWLRANAPQYHLCWVFVFWPSRRLLRYSEPKLRCGSARSSNVGTSWTGRHVLRGHY